MHYAWVLWSCLEVSICSLCPKRIILSHSFPFLFQDYWSFTKDQADPFPSLSTQLPLTRDGRAGLFCHRAGLERAGLIFVQPGWAGAGWVGLASTHKNRAAGFFPSINWLFVLQVLFFTANDWRKQNLNKKGIMKYFLGGPSQGIRGSQGFILPHLEMVS